MILVFIWIQGSWKWTQARLLQEENNFKLYETGWALREIAQKETELWKLVKSTIESWKQVSPEIIEDIFKDVITSNIWNNLILDWFVRNKWNKISADRIVWNYKVVFFDLPKKIAIERLVWRMYNPKTQETFPSWTFIDPKTWDELIKRADDEENSIMERINLFYEKTMPIVEEYKEEWNLISINANQSVELVRKELIEKLKF